MTDRKFEFYSDGGFEGSLGEQLERRKYGEQLFDEWLDDEDTDEHFENPDPDDDDFFDFDYSEDEFNDT